MKKLQKSDFQCEYGKIECICNLGKKMEKIGSKFFWGIVELDTNSQHTKLSVFN